MEGGFGDLFRPPPGATSWQIRRAGLLLAGLGALYLVLGLAALVALSKPLPWLTNPNASGALALPGVGAIVFGGYRAVAGAEPDAPGTSSAKRITLAVVGGCGSLLVATVLLILLAVLASAAIHSTR
jgi:hypothetical protein